MQKFACIGFDSDAVAVKDKITKSRVIIFVSLSMKKMAKKKEVTFNAGRSLCGYLLFKNPSPW